VLLAHMFLQLVNVRIALLVRSALIATGLRAMIASGIAVHRPEMTVALCRAAEGAAAAWLATLVAMLSGRVRNVFGLVG